RCLSSATAAAAWWRTCWGSGSSSTSRCVGSCFDTLSEALSLPAGGLCRKDHESIARRLGAVGLGQGTRRDPCGRRETTGGSLAPSGVANRRGPALRGPVPIGRIRTEPRPVELDLRGGSDPRNRGRAAGHARPVTDLYFFCSAASLRSRSAFSRAKYSSSVSLAFAIRSPA